MTYFRHFSPFLSCFAFFPPHLIIPSMSPVRSLPMSEEKGSSGDTSEFYLRYYVGHEGQYGHEFLEFELRPDGLLRYANHSKYRGDGLIRKEVRVSPTVQSEFMKIVGESCIMAEDDAKWPEANEDGRQELEIVMDGQHISFVVRSIYA